jgi:hypothetical protein
LFRSLKSRADALPRACWLWVYVRRFAGVLVAAAAGWLAVGIGAVDAAEQHRRRVAARSGGNPIGIESAVRSLKAQPIIADARWRPKRSGARLSRGADEDCGRSLTRTGSRARAQ